MKLVALLFFVLISCSTCKADWLNDVFNWLDNAAQDSSDWVQDKAIPSVENAVTTARNWLKNRDDDAKNWLDKKVFDSDSENGQNFNQNPDNNNNENSRNQPYNTQFNDYENMNNNDYENRYNNRRK